MLVAVVVLASLLGVTLWAWTSAKCKCEAVEEEKRVWRTVAWINGRRAGRLERSAPPRTLSSASRMLRALSELVRAKR